MIKKVELFLGGLEIREFNVGKNCEKITEVFSDGIHGVCVKTLATETREAEEITFVDVPYVLYIKR